MTLIAFMLWMEVAPAAPVRLVVIVSPAQGVTNISSADLRAIYLGEISRWPARRRIVPVIVTPRSLEGQLFIRRFVRMAEVDYAQHWIGMVFRGRVASAPLVASSSEEAARFIGAHAQAIAVIAEVPRDTNVRVLTVDGKSLDAADYPLRW